MAASSPAKPKKEIILTLATHWDREWYQSFQGFRFRLVPTMERILDALEKDSRIRLFHLDGQTSLVEDVLEVRPALEGRIRKLIGEGRLLPGPWYTMPDTWLVSAESFLRNLELGIHQSQALGNDHRAGYVCDLFGFHSQVPQLFAMCGVEGAFLFRGTTDETHPRDFLWTSPDGSQILCHRFTEEGGYCEFFSFVRNADRSKGVPINLDAATDRAVAFIEKFLLTQPGSVALASDGADHSDLEPTIADLVERINKKLSGAKVRIGSWVEYARLREKDSGLKKIEGELRTPAARPNTPNWVISNTLSSHPDLKLWNRRVEDLLARVAEPMAAWAALATGRHDLLDFLKVAWKHLLQNHAHDSICGCSIDAVHLDMEYRFRQAEQITREVITKAGRNWLPILLSEKDGFTDFLVFNPHPYAIEKVLDVAVHLPPVVSAVDPNDVANMKVISGYPHYINGLFGEAVPQLAVYGEDKKEVLHVVRKIEPKVTVRNQVDGSFPVVAEFERVHLAVAAKLQPLGFTRFRVTPRDLALRPRGGMVRPPNSLENDFLKVALAADGTITLTDKETGREYPGLFFFESGADYGDGWFYNRPVADTLTLSGPPAACTIVENSEIRSTLRFDYLLRVPAEMDYPAVRRSDRTVDLPISLELSLEKNSRRLETKITVSNCAKDHRLRVGFRTGVEGKISFTSTPADIVGRPIAQTDHSYEIKEIVTSLPSTGLSMLRDKKGSGLAVLHPGVYETWFPEEYPGVILVTLLRSFRRTIFTQGETRGQVQGDLEYRFAIMPVRPATSNGELLTALDEVALPLECIAGAPGQELKTKLFAQLLSSVSGEFVLTTVRPLDNGGFEVRGYNPSTTKSNVKLSFGCKVSRVESTNAIGEFPKAVKVTGGTTCTVALAGKKFLNLRCYTA